MILLIENRQEEKSAIESELAKEGYDVTVSNNITKAYETINDDGIRMVIIDDEFSDNDSISICTELRAMRFKSYVYILIVIQDTSQGNLQDIFNAGADDFISKASIEQELDVRVKVGMRMLELEDKLIQTRKELIKVAKEDPLTGLLNRRSFMDEAISELERATRDHRIVSAIIIEIDSFKDLVDRHGYEARDNMLVELAVRLQSTCRAYDKAANYGSGVFVILLPNTRIKTALKISKRIQSEISSRSFYLLGESVGITACFGVSLIAPDVGLKDGQLNVLMKRANLALKTAKKEGRNKIAVSADG